MPARPTSAADMSRVFSKPPAATICASSPSRIQAVPSPKITSQWNFTHGMSCIRAGMRLRTGFSSSCVVSVVVTALPFLASSHRLPAAPPWRSPCVVTPPGTGVVGRATGQGIAAGGRRGVSGPGNLRGGSGGRDRCRGGAFRLADTRPAAPLPSVPRYHPLLPGRQPVSSRAAERPRTLGRFGSPGRNRTYVACPDSKSGGPCQQTNRGPPLAVQTSLVEGLVH